jgi:hypothetical protein
MTHLFSQLVAEPSIVDNNHTQDKVSVFCKTFSIGKLLHRSGVRKHHVYRPGFLLGVFSTLPFIDMNLYRGITLNDKWTIVKDTAYEAPEDKTYNWQLISLQLRVKRD